MANGPQFVCGAIERLEKRYGSPIDYYQPLTRVVDLTTGDNTSNYTSLTIRKALLLPFKITRGFTYDTAFLAAGNGDAKNFSYGALHDTDESSVVLRKRDLKSLKPRMEDHISCHAERYDVKSVEVFPDIQIYVLSVVRTQSCKDYYFRTQHGLDFDNSGDLT